MKDIFKTGVIMPDFKVDLFVFIYNEIKILPFLLQHYSFCDKITFIDGQSNDGSIELISQYPNCEILELDSGGEIRDDLHLFCRQELWKKSEADWVIFIDADEFITIDKQKLIELKNDDYNIIKCFGYNMVSEEFPSYSFPITEQIKQGVFSEEYSKPAIFRPDCFSELGVIAGGHDMKPKEPAKVYYNEDVKLLHYNKIGYEYVLDKHVVNCRRKSKSDLARNWGWQHGISHSKYFESYFELLYKAKDII